MPWESFRGSACETVAPVLILRSSSNGDSAVTVMISSITDSSCGLTGSTLLSGWRPDGAVSSGSTATQAGVVRDQVVAQAQVGDAAAHLLRVPAVGQAVRQALDLAARPELVDARALEVAGHRERVLPGRASPEPGDVHRSGAVLEARGHDQRLAQVEVGNAGGPGLGRGIAPLDLDLPEHGRLELREQRAHGFADPGDIGDPGERAAAQLPQPGQEWNVGSRANRHREEPAVAQIRLEELDDLRLVIELPVGSEDHLRRRGRAVPVCERRSRRPETAPWNRPHRAPR